MSKIPLADEGLRQEDQELFARKKFVRTLIISAIGLLILTGIIALIEYSAFKGLSDPNLALRIIGDSIGLSGILGICWFVLTYVASKGAFDLLSYSTKLLFLVTFRPKYRKENFPKSYYEYKVLHDSENRRAVYPLLWLSLIFLGAGIIILTIYANL